MYCPTCGAENPEGSKVCEKCGANLTEGIENIGNSQLSDEVEVEYAGFFRRAIAYIIDLIVLLIIGYIVKLATGTGAVYDIAEIIIAIAYFVIMESSKFQGTLGKMALGIKITDENGSRISIITALLRYIVFQIFTIVSTLVALTETKIKIDPNNIQQLSKIYTMPSTIVSYVGLVYDIILLITILSSEANQGLHDRIAKTYVVMK
ncbi:RDD family protein [Clostridium hydrogenum]|uniref:RDD family protein n=1 Tax=Clostridium hydrogenum TaxID=2855764 RepID=UPI001F42B109|nr:RDD family protein [Clostridium hydrogenum]